MVKRRIATDIGETVTLPAGKATEEVTVTTARNGADDFRHHSVVTSRPTGRCLTHPESAKGKRSKPPLCLGRRLIYNCGLIQSPMR